MPVTRPRCRRREGHRGGNETRARAIRVQHLEVGVIEVLDSDRDGAFFGANALAALKAGQGPLAGLDIGMQHHDYDWGRPALLEGLVGELTSAGAIIAASSEGALFEYGSDEAIVDSLVQ